MSSRSESEFAAVNFDPLCVIERGYDLRADDREWLTRVVEALTPRLDTGSGVSASLQRYDAHGDVIARFQVGSAPKLEQLARLTDEIARRVSVHDLTNDPYYGAVLPSWSADPRVREALHHLSHRVPCKPRDLIVFQVSDGMRSRLTVCARSVDKLRLRASTKRVMLSVAVHIGAGMRLRSWMRERLADGAGVVRTAAEVVAGPYDFAIAPERGFRAAVDGQPPSQTAHAVASGATLDIWTALASGRYTIVTWLGPAEQRRAMVYENRIKEGDPQGLSPREQEIAGYLVHGRSNAEIAAALGLKEGTVSRTSRIALRKLGRARRSDLPAVFGGQNVKACALVADASLMVLGRGDYDRNLLQGVRPSEVAVLRLALSGSSNAMIARTRGRSTHTVANQLARVYARLGVRGRAELAALLGAEV